MEGLGIEEVVDVLSGGDAKAERPSEGILEVLALNLLMLALVLGPMGACCGLFSMVLARDMVLYRTDGSAGILSRVGADLDPVVCQRRRWPISSRDV